MGIEAIGIKAMTIAAVTTVGARRRCPRGATQGHRRRRGPGVAPEPGEWLTTRTVSAGGGHGPILVGKSEAGAGGAGGASLASTQRAGEIFTSGRDFLHRG
jgi:hypothetical protein